MPKKREKITNVTCKICNGFFETAPGFKSHLKAHGLTVMNYIIQMDYNGVRPVCAECGAEVILKNHKFQKYCKDHFKIGLSEKAKEVGFQKGCTPWSKGLTKEDHPTLMKMSIKNSGEGNPAYGKSYEVDNRVHMLPEEEYYNRLSERCVIPWMEEYSNPEGKELILNTRYEDYWSRQKQRLKFTCLQCNEELEQTLTNYERKWQCRKCYPTSRNSKQQLEVYDFIRSIVPEEEEVILNTRSVITPKELDIYVPSRNFALEYNGLYWHTEEYIEPDAHRVKTELCEEKGILLFHLFSDEWENKRPIVESMIRTRLQLVTDKISARACEIRKVPQKDAKLFFNANHIDGYARSRARFGLYYGDKLVSAVSVVVPRFGSEGQLEIARFASKLNTIVNGGFQRLLKRVKKYAINNEKKSIISYADRRFGSGKVYETTGFGKISDTRKSYWYTDMEIRFPRQKFMADKRRGLTERQVAELAGVFKVFGCGSFKYELMLD